MSEGPIIKVPEPGTQPSLAADAPTTRPDFLHPTVDTPKHSYHPKRVILILILLVVVSLLVVGSLILYAAMPQRIKQVPATKQATTQAIAPLTAVSTIALLRPSLPTAVDAKQVISLPVMTKGKDFYTVIPDATPVVGVRSTAPQKDQTKTLTNLSTTLTKNHFSERIAQTADATGGYLAYYTRDDVICQVTSATPAKDTTATEADCTDTTQYADYANAQQVFVNNYAPASSSSVIYAYIGKPVTGPSKTAGYTLADMTVNTVVDQQLSTSGTLAAFYQTPDQLWHYFVDHDSNVIIDCSKYNTPDLLYAYAGQPCKDSSSGKTLIVTAPKTSK